MSRTKPTLLTLLRHLKRIGLANELRAVCKQHFVSIEEVLSTSRTPDVSAARRACFAFLSAAPYLMHPSRVARLLGCNHTTVLHALKTPEQRAARAMTGKLRLCGADPASGTRARLAS